MPRGCTPGRDGSALGSFRITRYGPGVDISQLRSFLRRCRKSKRPRRLSVIAAEIRPAVTEDLSPITAIYNDVIATSTAVYSLLPTAGGAASLVRVARRGAFSDSRRSK